MMGLLSFDFVTSSSVYHVELFVLAHVEKAEDFDFHHAVLQYLLFVLKMQVHPSDFFVLRVRDDQEQLLLRYEPLQEVVVMPEMVLSMRL